MTGALIAAAAGILAAVIYLAGAAWLTRIGRETRRLQQISGQGGTATRKRGRGANHRPPSAALPAEPPVTA